MPETTQDVRYNAESMVLHDGRPRYTGKKTLLHTALEAKDSDLWRRLKHMCINMNELLHNGLTETHDFDIDSHFAYGKPRDHDAGEVSSVWPFRKIVGEVGLTRLSYRRRTKNLVVGEHGRLGSTGACRGRMSHPIQRISRLQHHQRVSPSLNSAKQ